MCVSSYMPCVSHVWIALSRLVFLFELAFQVKLVSVAFQFGQIDSLFHNMGIGCFALPIVIKDSPFHNNISSGFQVLFSFCASFISFLFFFFFFFHAPSIFLPHSSRRAVLEPPLISLYVITEAQLNPKKHLSFPINTSPSSFFFSYQGYKMIGSFVTRILVMVFGYAYPAYECYKAVEKNRPEIEQLRFWCQYWILVALLTVCERIGDTFISWVPMYSETKLAFFIYLWYPKTKGTTYVYDSFFRPYVAKHEPDIDRNLMELKTRAGDIAVSYWQKAASYGQTRIFDILQYVAAQSTPTARPAQVAKHVLVC
ncbi:abscisic acid-responsive (TB2/DP1, HVA22) family protein [Medicago truncatula]|uniref:HVA22-like protein n=1 Tax=Medicago truncatula TaxID=3880 RepID=A0A072VDJ8_MEDTR|nr:abscisic acid-responsive (TB2/DP1, HVA22) family protein [Medicago truncatula]